MGITRGSDSESVRGSDDDGTQTLQPRLIESGPAP